MEFIRDPSSSSLSCDDFESVLECAYSQTFESCDDTFAVEAVEAVIQPRIDAVCGGGNDDSYDDSDELPLCLLECLDLFAIDVDSPTPPSCDVAKSGQRVNTQNFTHLVGLGIS